MHVGKLGEPLRQLVCLLGLGEVVVGGVEVVVGCVEVGVVPVVPSCELWKESSDVR